MSSALKLLTDGAIAVRYPGNVVTSKQAGEFFEICCKMRRLARPSLGLPE
jgi:hypothetical protein